MTLAKAETAALLRRLYEEQPPSADVVQAWPEFRALRGKLAPGDGHKVALSALQDMIADLKRVGSREIVIHDGKIGYVENDGVNYSSFSGYTTLFEYIKAEKEKKLTAADADAKIGLILQCGSIAYADMPKTYAAVLGVTGTLAALAKEEMDVLRTEYSIAKTTLIPSIYGGNTLHKTELKWSPVNDTKLLPDDDSLHQMIAKRAAEARRNGQAALIYFMDEEALAAFQQSSYGVSLLEEKSRAQVLTERTTNKKHVVRRATESGMVTLATAALGRGVDFTCQDEQVERAGGVLVLQTFYSWTKSEEAQIRGRTARQGQQGEYALYLSQESLPSSGKVSKADVVAATKDGRLYDMLDKVRAEEATKRVATLRDLAEAARKRGKTTKEFYDQLLKGEATLEDYLPFMRR